MAKFQSSWVSYLDSIDASATAIVTSEEFRHHANALMWAFGLIMFGFCVLAYDTRNTQSAGDPTETRYLIRDHILGMEQRHFIVVLNGILLYVSLAFLAGPF